MVSSLFYGWHSTLTNTPFIALMVHFANKTFKFAHSNNNKINQSIKSIRPKSVY